ncbi:MAG: ECF-type sigma factor [Gemmatimonadales bacterium]
MTERNPSEITELLQALERGEAGAADRLAPAVYGELHRLATRALAGERPDHTLQPTALVHDAFLALADWRAATWQDRSHFYRTAARVMRRVLVDHARARLAGKRRGDLRITLDGEAGPGDDSADRTLDVIALEEAMTRLEAEHERPAQVVELRFFAGFDVDETARALGVSTASVVRDWAFARAFLKRALAS